MSLDNVQLPPIVLQDLFKNSLVSTGLDNGGSKPSSSMPGFSFLGDNQKKIAIIVSDATAIYLPDEDLNFLLGILKACNLNMADIALLNLATNPSLNHVSINQELAPEKILLFGVTPMVLELPLQFPHYQVQHYNNQVYLSSPALSTLQKNKEEKIKLWTCLKKIFLPG